MSVRSDFLYNINHYNLSTAAALRDGFLPARFIEGSSRDAGGYDPHSEYFGFYSQPAHLNCLSRKVRPPSSPERLESASPNPASRPPTPDFGMSKKDNLCTNLSTYRCRNE